MNISLKLNENEDEEIALYEVNKDEDISDDEDSTFYDAHEFLQAGEDKDNSHVQDITTKERNCVLQFDINVIMSRLKILVFF